jgi:PAS domain S-box-containing protein
MAPRKSNTKKAKSPRKTSTRKKSKKASSTIPPKSAGGGLKDFADNISLMENKHYGVCLFDAENFKLLFANEYLRNKIGYTKKELSGLNLLKLVTPEDCNRIIKTVKARIKGGPVITGNRYTARRKNGLKFPIEAFSNPVIHKGKICIQSIINDITDLVELENNLRESESRFKSFFQLSPEAVLTFDQHGRVTSVNKAAERLTGYKDSMLIGQLYHRLPFWHDSGKVKRLKLADITGIKPFQRFIKGSHDDIKIVEIFSSKIPMERGEYEILLIARDITARKQYEDRLLKSERKHKALVNNILDGIAVVSEGKYIHVDKKFARIFGYPISELKDRAFTKIVTGGWKKILADLETQIWRGKSSYRQLDINGRKKDGTLIDLDLRASRIEYEGKRALQITVTDISRRKNAEERLRESEEKLKAIFHSIDDSVFVIDKKGRFVHFEKPGKNGVFYGKTPRILGKDVMTVVPPHMAKSFRKILREIAATMKSYQRTYSIEASGKIYWFSTRFSPLRDDQGHFSGITVVARDVTNIVRAHRQLKHERDLTSSILETANSLIVCLDHKGRITIFNRECELVTGYKREEVIGRDWAGMFLPASLRSEVPMDFVAWVKSHPHDRYEGPLLTKAGEIRTILWSNSSIIGRTDQEFIAIAIGHDITDRKRADKALSSSEEKYRTLVENAGEAITAVDREGHFIIMNTIAAKRLGGKPEDYVGKTMWDAFPQIIADRQVASVRDVIESGRGILDESPTVLQGEQRWYQTSVQPLPDHEGNINFALIIATDVTSRKKADEEIRKFKTIADEATYGTAIADLDGNLVYVNECFAEMHGYTAEDLIGRNLSIFHSQSQISNVNRLNERLIREGSYTSEEVWHMRRDGTEFPTLMSANVIKDDMGCPILFSATALDITERRMAEEALRESQRCQRAILSNIPDMAWLKDRESSYIAVNEQFGRECGVSPEELVGKNDLDVWPRELAERYRADDREVIELGQRKRVEEPLADKDGKIKIIETIKTPIYNDKGEIIGTTGIARDITERKLAEEALRMSEERLSSIFSGSRDAIFITGADSMFSDVNRAAEELTGYSKEELLKMSIPDLHDDEDLQAYRLFFKRIMNGESITSEANIRRKDGRKIPTEFSNKRIFIGDAPYMHTAARDITERKQAERALRNQRDMLRDVTGDVIRVQEDERRRISMELHDSTGQSLSVIRLQIQNIIKSVKNGNYDVNGELEVISKLVLDTISDLRQISANLRPVILDNLGLWPTIEWYLQDFGKKTDLAVKVDIEEVEVNLSPRDEVHIFRIIQEIMINIQKHSEAKKVSFKSGIEDSKLVFEIREDGRGFDPKLMFEPSERRRGMGLINIMERVNIVKGHLDIQSSPGQGAKFMVSVPIR